MFPITTLMIIWFEAAAEVKMFTFLLRFGSNKDSFKCVHLIKLLWTDLCGWLLLM